MTRAADRAGCAALCARGNNNIACRTFSFQSVTSATFHAAAAPGQFAEGDGNCLLSRLHVGEINDGVDLVRDTNWDVYELLDGGRECPGAGSSSSSSSAAGGKARKAACLTERKMGRLKVFRYLEWIFLPSDGKGVESPLLKCIFRAGK